MEKLQKISGLPYLGKVHVFCAWIDPFEEKVGLFDDEQPVRIKTLSIRPIPIPLFLEDFLPLIWPLGDNKLIPAWKSDPPRDDSSSWRNEIDP